MDRCIDSWMDIQCVLMDGWMDALSLSLSIDPTNLRVTGLLVEAHWLL